MDIILLHLQMRLPLILKLEKLEEVMAARVLYTTIGITAGQQQLQQWRSHNDQYN